MGYPRPIRPTGVAGTGASLGAARWKRSAAFLRFPAGPPAVGARCRAVALRRRARLSLPYITAPAGPVRPAPRQRQRQRRPRRSPAAASPSAEARGVSVRQNQAGRLKMPKAEGLPTRFCCPARVSPCPTGSGSVNGPASASRGLHKALAACRGTAEAVSPPLVSPCGDRPTCPNHLGKTYGWLMGNRGDEAGERCVGTQKHGEMEVPPRWWAKPRGGDSPFFSILVPPALVCLDVPNTAVPSSRNSSLVCAHCRNTWMWFMGTW